MARKTPAPTIARLCDCCGEKLSGPFSPGPRRESVGQFVAGVCSFGCDEGSQFSAWNAYADREEAEIAAAS